jgi:hypothetical protein
MSASEEDKEPSEKEIAKRADAGLRALLKMPPKPHSEIAGKSKSKKAVQRKKRTKNDD